MFAISPPISYRESRYLCRNLALCCTVYPEIGQKSGGKTPFSRKSSGYFFGYYYYLLHWLYTCILSQTNTANRYNSRTLGQRRARRSFFFRFLLLSSMHDSKSHPTTSFRASMYGQCCRVCFWLPAGFFATSFETFWVEKCSRVCLSVNDAVTPRGKISLLHTLCCAGPSFIHCCIALGRELNVR